MPKFRGRATLAIVLVSALALTACTKKNDETTSSSAPASGQSAAASGSGAASGAKVKVAFVDRKSVG